MEILGIQQKFLDLANQKLSPNISLVDEIADLLNISKDSAYRRLRCETTLTFDEISVLCNKFEISLDTLLHVDHNLVTFNFRAIGVGDFTFEKYLESILDNLETINQFEIKELIYAAKDVPLFHDFVYPELSSFKIFFWLKTILNHPDYRNRTFDWDVIPESTITLGQRIWEKYMITPSLEIWTEGTVNVTLNQVSFYYESGVLNKTQSLRLLDVYQDLIDHIKSEAELGRKFYKDKDTHAPDNYKIYYNELSIPDNTIFFTMGDTKITYVTYNLLNILTTSNIDFCNQTHVYLNNIISKSTLVSKVAEKERNKLFNIMRSRIEKLKEKIDASVESH